DEQQPTQPKGDMKKTLPKPAGKAAGKPYVAFSDDEEDVKRVVKSEREKRYDELREIIKKMKNAKRIRDIGLVFESFENLTKAFDKARKVVEKDQAIPRFYIRTLVELEDFVNECWKDHNWRDTLDRNNTKNLNSTRQKIKRYNKSDAFLKETTAYRENPDVGADVDALESDLSANEAESDDDDIHAPKAPVPVPSSASAAAKMKSKSKDNEDESEESDDWDVSDEASTGDEIDLTDVPKEELYKIFLKKPDAPGAEREKIDKATRDKDEKDKIRNKQKIRREKQLEPSDEEDEIPSRQDHRGLVIFGKDEEVTHDAIMKKLNEIIALRGKKSANRREQLECLHILRQYVDKQNLGVGLDVKILLVQIAVSFDYHHKGNECLKPETWTRALDYIDELLNLLANNLELQISENISEESENLKDGPNYRIHGDVITIIVKMDEEFTKILQNCDAHSQEYVDRLKDELRVCAIIERLKAYLESKVNEQIMTSISSTNQPLLTPESIPLVNSQHLCTIYLRAIEHLYYKYDQDSEQPSKQIMDRLCKFIYTKDTLNRARARASLCHVYHHALHDRYYEARDLMLMCHMQDTITSSDVSTQILYNRTIVQLGLCAFRFGSIKEAHQALV
ncbi:unnamed protein product, partial [Didymodactylos carnosus]